MGSLGCTEFTDSMPIPRISLAAVLACGALALFTGRSDHGPDTLVTDPTLARTYADPVAALAAPPGEVRRSLGISPRLPADSPPLAQAAPIAGQLIPPPPEGPQRHFSPSPEQWENAHAIVGVVRARELPLYTAVIALATAMQESSLHNLTDAADYDSLGLFQQRPSAGWGDPDQLTDPAYAAGAFLDALLSRVPDYAAVPLWQAAQRTQASAFPERYAQWEDQATEMVVRIAAE